MFTIERKLELLKNTYPTAEIVDFHWVGDNATLNEVLKDRRTLYIEGGECDREFCLHRKVIVCDDVDYLGVVSFHW